MDKAKLEPSTPEKLTENLTEQDKLARNNSKSEKTARKKSEALEIPSLSNRIVQKHVKIKTANAKRVKKKSASGKFANI